MKLKSVLILCLLIISAVLSAQNKTALLIANGSYSHFSSLANPVPEAQLLKDTLQKLGFQVSLVTDAGKEEMIDSIFEFEAALKDRGGIAFFHYGGHAVQVDGLNYLIPADASIPDERRVDSRAVNIDEITAALEASSSETNIVILDSCRNNPLPAASGRSASRGLAMVGRKPPNSVIVYSAESGTVAQDGVFTPTLIASLQIPGLSLQEILMQTRQQVYQTTKGAQIPGEYNQLFYSVYLSGNSGNENAAAADNPEMHMGSLSVSLATAGTLRVNNWNIEVPANVSQAVNGLAPGEYTLDVRYVDGSGERRIVTVEPGRTLNVVFSYIDESRIQKEVPQGFVLIKAGSFTMGSPVSEVERSDSESQHTVSLTRDFSIAKTEVTQKLWTEVMGINPSHFRKGDNYPVEMISWNDAVEFCNRLSLNEGLTPCYSGAGNTIECDFEADGYRLPTEAEWEYAAREGQLNRGYTIFSGSNYVNTVGWYGGNSGKSSHPVARKEANELGLFDMSGNVAEWVWDRYGSYQGQATNPTGSFSGSERVIRGGGWYNGPERCRSANRGFGSPVSQSYNIGFRLVRTIK